MTTIQEQEYAKYSQYDTTQGVYFTQQERVNELNDRISSRFFPDAPLEPHYDPRPVSTSRTIFPMKDPRRPVTEPKQDYSTHDMNRNFAPSNSSVGPFSGFAVDTENLLRNSTVALQKYDLPSQYIPSSQSDLYNVSVPVSAPLLQPFEGLFRTTELAQPPNPNVVGSRIGKDQFFNHTRVQLRNGL